MSAIRNAARRVLEFVVRHAPPATRSWGDAMMREMDVIDDDWAALSWALGSTMALCRHSVIEQMRNVQQRRPSALQSVLLGISAAAIVLMVSMSARTMLERTSWYAPSQGRQLALMFAVVIPDTLGLLGGVALWRPHGRLASGILAAGAALGAHSILFFVA
jgi:hypothetical protein